jgi:hypothetical protein
MQFAGRTTGVMTGFQPQVKRSVIQAAADDEDFLGIVVGFPASVCGNKPDRSVRESGPDYSRPLFSFVVVVVSCSL